jgi:chromate transporter
MAMLPRAMSEPTTPRNDVTLREIFLAFLIIGATSFGGGVVAYLRSSLVGKHQWLDDPDFVRMLSISQTLPGLNATNMAVLVGDRLRGVPGAIAAITGICLPGGLFMFVVGMVHRVHGDRPFVTAMLHGVAAAAVGLILAVTVQLGRKSLHRPCDLVLVALPVIGVNLLHLPIPWVLFGVGASAVWWFRPRPAPEQPLQ